MKNRNKYVNLATGLAFWALNSQSLFFSLLSIYGLFMIRDFTVKENDKIAVLADNEIAKTVLFQILAGELKPDSGEIKWGTTISTTYFPKDNN